MHKNPQRQNVDLHHLGQQRLYQGLTIINPKFAQDHSDSIAHLHTWDYSFWLKYLDLQRQALNLKPIFNKLDDQADETNYQINMQILKTNQDQTQKQQKASDAFIQTHQPVINKIIEFWQTYPITIHGSEAYLHAMAKTFFRNKISYEEPAQGRQIKRTLTHLSSRNWQALQIDLLDYKGWWN